jgi:DNA-binding transcriptional MerR regulator
MCALEYTIQELSQMAGISSRTLRYYEQFGLLKPARRNGSGYRIYTEAEVDKLQQILFYRELDVSLECIKDLIEKPSFEVLQALKDHREKLLEKRAQLNILIENVEKTIASKEGRIKMKDAEKFEGFKKALIADNEEKYGKEIRTLYGDKVVNRSNEKLKEMTQADFEEATRLSTAVMETLQAAFKTGNPAGTLAQKAADLHRQWLSYYWDSYNKEAHAGLAQMYVYDQRFRIYYDKEQPGTAEFLRDAVLIYTGKM